MLSSPMKPVTMRSAPKSVRVAIVRPSRPMLAPPVHAIEPTMIIVDLIVGAVAYGVISDVWSTLKKQKRFQPKEDKDE